MSGGTCGDVNGMSLPDLLGPRNQVWRRPSRLCRDDWADTAQPNFLDAAKEDDHKCIDGFLGSTGFGAAEEKAGGLTLSVGWGR